MTLMRPAPGDPIRLKDLAERLRIAPRSATEVVDQLEVKGLVRRDPDPRTGAPPSSPPPGTGSNSLRRSALKGVASLPSTLPGSAQKIAPNWPGFWVSSGTEANAARLPSCRRVGRVEAMTRRKVPVALVALPFALCLIALAPAERAGPQTAIRKGFWGWLACALPPTPHLPGHRKNPLRRPRLSRLYNRNPSRIPASRFRPVAPQRLRRR